MMIYHYSIFWCIITCMASVDFTLIGHVKGWKKIKYPDWLGGIINKKRHYGYELLSDYNTHPQVIWFLFGSFFVLLGIVGLNIVIWKYINDIDTLIIGIIVLVLYIPSIIWIIVLKSYANKTYLFYSK